MNHNHNTIKRHLTEDEILVSLVGESDLDPGLHAHLKGCSQCNSEKTKIEQQLNDLGRLAKQMAPVPPRSFRLPETERRPSFWSGWKWSPTFGLMAVMVLVVVLVWPQATIYFHSFFGNDIQVQETKKDNQLIAEVDALVEDALPKKYRDILAGAETDVGQDFMQFIVPSIEDNNSKSLSFVQRGAVT